RNVQKSRHGRNPPLGKGNKLYQTTTIFQGANDSSTPGGNAVMRAEDREDLETDPRFPSGPWTGFFVQRAIPGRHVMELHLTFRAGEMTGEGRDWVGPFLLRGRYSVEDGKCHWTKRYLGKHDVWYKGFNEGKGIW